MDTTDTAGSPVRWREVLTPRLAPTVLMLAMAVWLHASDGLMIATMMPAIVSAIGGAPFIGWAFALYEIGSIVAGASAALLALRLGFGRAMALAAFVFAAGCSLSAMAPTMPIMLAGRLGQGLGGGGLVALAFVGVHGLFPPRLMPRVMAVLSALWGLSAFAGPLVGGLFADAGLWRGAFWLYTAKAVLLALAMLVVLGRRRPSGMDDRPTSVPVLRLACLGLGVTAIAAAGLDVGWPKTPLLIAMGVLAIVAMVRLDGRAGAARMLPANPFGLSTGPSATLTLVFSFSLATIPIGIYGPLILIGLHGLSALAAGYAIAASSIAWSVMAITVSGLPERYDGRTITLGFLAVAISVVGFALTMPTGPIWAIVAFAALEGGGFGTAWSFLLRRATALTPPADRVRIAAAIPTVQRFGYAIGAAGIGIVANAAGLATGDGAANAETLERVALWVFLACIPAALLGLLAVARLIALSRALSRDRGMPPDRPTEAV